MKIVYAILGLVFVGLGALGVALPILPTTPFLLLASACFIRSSDRFHAWFLSTKLYRRHLKDFAETRTLTMKRKLAVLIPVSSMLLVVFCMLDYLHARVLIVLLVMAKWYYFLFRIQTAKSPEACVEPAAEQSPPDQTPPS